MPPIWRGSIAGVEFTVHTAGDIDQVPSDSDKNVPHHHNYCHGHDVGAPARTTMEYTPVLTVPKPTISASASLDGRTGMVHLRPPSLTSDLGVRWRALSIIVRSPIFMNRILAAMLAAASCATMAQAQVGPSAPVAQDAPVYTLDQAVSAAGGSAPAAEAATAGIDAARAGRTVAGLRPNPVVQGQVENVIGSGPYRGSAARKPRSALRSRSS